MKFPDETLMAYADGELDEADAARRRGRDGRAIPRSPRRSPGIAPLRNELSGAFDGVLDEPFRFGCATAASATPAASVRSSPPRGPRGQAHRRRRWAWKEWTAIAASVLLGLFVGRTVLQAPDSEYVAARGQVSCSRPESLEEQPVDAAERRAVAGRPHRDRGDVPLDKTNEYCRAFNTGAPQSPVRRGVSC